MSPTVYLAGPIIDLKISDAREWRTKAIQRFGAHGICAISPLRSEPLSNVTHYAATYECPKFGTAKAIATKNIHDVRSCDVTLAYLPTPADGQRPPTGTTLEIGLAYGLGKTVVVATDWPTIQNHPLVQEMSSMMLDNLDDATDVIIALLRDYK